MINWFTAQVKNVTLHQHQHEHVIAPEVCFTWDGWANQNKSWIRMNDAEEFIRK